jgi:hypothetical protein
VGQTESRISLCFYLAVDLMVPTKVASFPCQKNYDFLGSSMLGQWKFTLFMLLVCKWH